MNKRTNKQMNEQTNEQTNKLTNKQMNKQTNEQTNERMQRTTMGKGWDRVPTKDGIWHLLGAIINKLVIFLLGKVNLGAKSNRLSCFLPGNICSKCMRTYYETEEGKGDDVKVFNKGDDCQSKEE